MGGVIAEVASAVSKRKDLTDPAPDMKAAKDRFLSGASQEAWDIITGMTDAQKQAVIGDAIPFPTEPLKVDVKFYVPRPKSLPKKICYATKKPDVDKLLRNILDALKGIIWTDDAQVVSVRADKHYALGMPGAVVCVDRVTQQAGGVQ